MGIYIYIYTHRGYKYSKGVKVLDSFMPGDTVDVSILAVLNRRLLCAYGLFI